MARQSDGPGKIFLGGISPTTTTEGIIEYFGQYGVVVDGVAMFQNGKPRCFGFVTYEDPEVAQTVLQVEHELDGHKVDMKLAVPKAAGAPPPMQHQHVQHHHVQHQPPPAVPARGKGGGQATDKVFVGGLSAETTTEVLQMYFERYGTLVDSVVMKDKVTGKPKGFGFVQYDNTDSVEAVMAEYEAHQIDGKWVECKRAVPKDKGAPASAPMGHGGFPGGGCKGGGFQGGKGGFPGGGMGGGFKGGCGGGCGFGGGYGGGGGCYGGGPPPFMPRQQYSPSPGGKPMGSYEKGGGGMGGGYDPRAFHSFEAPMGGGYGGGAPMKGYGGKGPPMGGKGGKHFAPY